MGDNPQSEQLKKLLGYLNFSEGRPDAGFQLGLAELFANAVRAGEAHPWQSVRDQLTNALEELRGEGAFQDAAQADRVLSVMFDRVLPAYREHHRDLLFHLDDDELFQPFFLVRVAEAVLVQCQRTTDAEELTAVVLAQLNDYVGHRPVAQLESRPKGEPYDHERVRPIPLFIRDAGAAPGRYHDLIVRTLVILESTDPDILADAHFSMDQLDELAYDPRAYDHSHPANRRPNYAFGEWDPHLIDNKGLYRRFVLRQMILDAALERIDLETTLPKDEVLVEAAAVMAGTILMAAGVRGNRPETHDSSVTLANLVPIIARYRDAFYEDLIRRLDDGHAARLRAEAELMHQPFGAARRHLNHFLARHRAAQMQQRHLALLMAEMGYPDASRRQALHIPAASVRMLSEMHIRLTVGRRMIDNGDLEDAAQLLTETEDLLHRGIACGALADPWNILGFGGMYPLFHAMEDSIHDPRIDELTDVLDETFNLYSHLLAESAARGAVDVQIKITQRFHHLAAWWDKFAAHEVQDVQPVHGGESAMSAEHVANALRLWHECGEKPADLAFWRDHLEGFQSPKAYALVVDALLRKEDYHAAMGLIMHWLSQIEFVPLEDGDYSFHTLALRWMLGYCQRENDAETTDDRGQHKTVQKFFDYLEANADEYWVAPKLEIIGIPMEEMEGDDEEEEVEEEEENDLFQAAYENVTYKDSTDDDIDMEVLDSAPEQVFDLENEGERIESHLRLLSTTARLWNVAARLARPPQQERTDSDEPDPLLAWQKQARRNYKDLLVLLDSIHDFPIPRPTGSYESMVEYDRRRVIKERLLHVTISASLDAWLAAAVLRSRRGKPKRLDTWKSELVLLEDALWRGDGKAARRQMPSLLKKFQTEPLLYTPLNHGGHPRQVLRASRAQTILRALAANLPRLGLLQEAVDVVQTAHKIERRQQLSGPRITEFNRIFQAGCQAAAEAVIDAAEADSANPDEAQLLVFLERAAYRYLPLWRDHSKTLRVSALELISTETEWSEVRSFIQRYGKELFHVQFMTFGNLRGILHQGVAEWFEFLRDNLDPMESIPLLDDLGQTISVDEAKRRLEVILQALIENYDIYKDYNATVTQSDYGENLWILLDFLRLKAAYERQAWHFRPLVHVHEVIARRRRSTAEAWQDQLTKAAAPLADRFLEQLEQLERTHGIRLNTVRDRLEERFVQPLALDRLCALVEPTMEAAGGDGADTALNELEEHLRPRTENPTGVGLDLPQWLQRLESAVHQVQNKRTAVAELAENLLQIPKSAQSLGDLEDQLPELPADPSSTAAWRAIINSLGKMGADDA